MSATPWRKETSQGRPSKTKYRLMSQSVESPHFRYLTICERLPVKDIKVVVKKKLQGVNGTDGIDRFLEYKVKT